MSYYAADENGYLDDVASVGGWSDFVSAAAEHRGVVSEFAEDAETDDPGALAEALDAVTFDNASAESVRAHLVDIARRASGLLVISDGDSDE